MRIFLIPLSIAFSNPKILGFLFLRKIAQSKEWNAKIKLQKIVASLLVKHEWNGHLEILSLPQGKENSKQFLLLRTDILQKTVVGCPWKVKYRNLVTTFYYLFRAVISFLPLTNLREFAALNYGRRYQVEWEICLKKCLNKNFAAYSLKYKKTKMITLMQPW